VAVIEQLAAEHPNLNIVLCHLGLATHEPTAEWRAALATLTVRPNVYAKVSGILSQPGSAVRRDAWAADAVAAAVDALGPDRLMFGSDWPMSPLVGGYAEVVERTALALPELTAKESLGIWRRTAERVYRVPEER